MCIAVAMPSNMVDLTGITHPGPYMEL